MAIIANSSIKHAVLFAYPAGGVRLGLHTSIKPTRQEKTRAVCPVSQNLK